MDSYTKHVSATLKKLTHKENRLHLDAGCDNRSLGASNNMLPACNMYQQMAKA